MTSSIAHFVQFVDQPYIDQQVRYIKEVFLKCIVKNVVNP